MFDQLRVEGGIQAWKRVCIAYGSFPCLRMDIYLCVCRTYRGDGRDIKDSGGGGAARAHRQGA